MYKLSNEKQAPIGDGYDIYIQYMEQAMGHVKTLKSLLTHKNSALIKNNETLALVYIKSSIEILEELRDAIKNINEKIY